MNAFPQPSTEERRRLPNLLVVGGPKCGTTSLYHYLQAHAGVFMSAVKEPHYLARSCVAGKIPAWVDSYPEYAALFEGAEAYGIRGEASVFYLYYHEETIRNALALLGRDVRIVMILRNPIDRLLSAYHHQVRHTFEEPCALPDALAREAQRIRRDDVNPMMHYKANGLYHAMVAAYCTRFERVKVLIHDDLAADAGGVLRDLFAFLGVDPDHAIDTSQRHNPGGFAWAHPGIRRLIIGDGPLRKSRERLRARNPELYNCLRGAFRAVFARRIRLDPSLRAELSEFYREDVARLSDLIGRDLSFWLDRGTP